MLESLFNKVAGLQAGKFIKKRFQPRCFPMKFAKFFRTPIWKNAEISSRKKKITERKIREKRGDKLAGGFGWRYKSLNGLKGAGVEP